MTLEKNKYYSIIKDMFEEFIGLSFEQIAHKINLNPDLVSNKASIVTIVNKMFEFKNLDRKTIANEFLPQQLSVKTIRLQTNGTPRESMSFENVNFGKLLEETWLDSRLRNKFANSVFLFVVFQYKEVEAGQVLIFKGIKLWQMPQETLDTEVKKLWQATRMVIKEGVTLRSRTMGKKTVIENNLPGKRDNGVAHIRPKANDSNDKVELPDSQMITKQAYWLNNDYIGSILQGMPEVYLKNLLCYVKKIKLSSDDIGNLKSKLTKHAYTVDEFINKSKQVIPNFTELDVTPELVAEIGFKIDNPFLITDSITNFNQYLDDIIFAAPYFQVPNDPVFLTTYVKRKIENYENDFKLLKIEENLYITNESLLNGGLTKQDLADFKNSVEQFFEYGEFFTFKSLEDRQFGNELLEYGFENIFYQSILMRPGRLKYLKLTSEIVFVKSKRNITIDDLISYLMAGDRTLTVDHFVERANEKCNLIIDYDYAPRLMQKASYYYSEDLMKIYENKEIYYNEIYN
ncbi:MutH/Sau3AI family endonuclease [Cytobacillus oceanisediminis]|uniref:MutH/Sau3AI family endonuclease n=1 Tax=Cytobacillus oceanisediminis TaxID=665099 RepID=UPI0011A7FFAB|nr:MutH/Sau3AI family endonuclease [Cytobacillus oceanisediminis]